MKLQDFKNSMTYNNMTRMMVYSPDRIAYFSDFQNWNSHEDEMIAALLKKAAELNVEPLLFVSFNEHEFSSDLYIKENIEALAHKASPQLHVLFYVINGLTDKMPHDALIRNLQEMMGIKYAMVNDNYQDPICSQFNTNFFKVAWGDKVVLHGNYATKPENTELRALIEASDFDLFTDETELEYLITGRVVHGKQLGRTIGYPTANVLVAKDSPMKHGVFAVRVKINAIDNLFEGMGCYWVNERGENLFEVTIFDFDEEIYERRIIIEPVQKLHDIKKVNSLDELKAMLKQDQELSQELFASLR
jgi:riboflavin kinase/FMN adenylyltransferase